MAFLLILENRRKLSDRQGIDIIWQTVKFFRNIEFYPWAQKFYENKPAGLVFPEYNRRALDHTYFYCLLKSRNTATPEILLNYLRAESENLLKGGLQEASPWLVLLTQVKGLFPKADFSENGLGFYYNAFKSIVPAGSLKKQLDVINADSEDIIGYLKEAIVKLEKVIGQDDFVYDNNSALLLSNRTMVYSFRHKNVTGFLLSMRIKADFSILFEPKYVGDLVPFVLQEADVSGLDAIYNIPVTWLSPLTEPKEATLIWLGIVERKLFQLTFFQQKFIFTEPPKWSFKKFSIKRNSKYFSKLKFYTSKKVRGQVRSIDPDEHFAIEAEMARQLEFGRISTPVNAQFVFVVKDINLAPFPHNLLLDINGEFIAKTIPVTNVISAEWLKSRGEVFLSANYSKAIWIPTESNDDTLPYLYSHLEDEITTRHFEISQLIDPPKPLSADLNIICAHGAKDIAELQVLFHGNEMSFNMNKIVGKGKLLIMFVCHSGSAKNQLFKNESVSLISRFIQQGYEAVVAPAWALDITVVRIWLPVFLSSIDDGDTIDQAVFKANVAVFNQIPNPAAWACLHLYGNPGLKIQ